MEHQSTVQDINTGSRSRQRGRRNKKKDYSDRDPCALTYLKPCNHGKRSKFHCNMFATRDILKSRKALYKNLSKVEQDAYLSRFISVYDPVRRRQSKIVPQTTRPKQRSVTFFLTRNRRPKAVCKKLFVTAMGLSRGRVDVLVRRLGNGEIIKENRGGDRKSRKSAVIKQKIIEFINKFDAVESHYNRLKSKRVSKIRFLIAAKQD